MREAKEASESRMPMKTKPAQDANDALAEANVTIFRSIYPAVRFAELNGVQRLQQCGTGPNGEAKAPPQILDALKQTEGGDPASLRAAADAMANYERRSVVQDQIYSNKRYKEAFEKNEWWSQRPLGRWMGAKRPELPLSPTCSGAPSGNRTP